MRILICEKESGRLARDFKLSDFEFEVHSKSSVQQALKCADDFRCVVFASDVLEVEDADVVKTISEKFVATNILTLRSGEDRQIQDLDNGALYSLDANASSLLIRAFVKTLLISAMGVRDFSGSLSFDHGKKDIFYRGKPLGLSYAESTIFHSLLINQGRIVSRLQLAEVIPNADSLTSFDDKYVDVLIGRLRKKISNPLRADFPNLSEDDLREGVIGVVRGEGYRLRFFQDIDDLLQVNDRGRDISSCDFK